ncbi:hypothetical protein AB1K32_03175 [Metabacillus dongyingensis]|uniref:Uncharacterized protein n=1 Tax=Metabacillus hrfriensis TaxID=3048891 RepID=A0ACD4R7C5_9BACI|nr:MULTISPECIES: hypothetical protein [Bacillaceae]UOK56813.1 hypothetical protein MGI18_18800 [Bacillus sp. OVS6]USK27035.1 hypothetical protein LIT32_16275 [Bacillus sp. CMF21]USK32266.1 hypothetical protein LIT25_16875 [Bacillus sp. F19]MCM3596892.1 hypothetical protein [Metabacillus idriensis]MDR0139741.1 hypothetical protein [Metabacillus idriensis]
MYKGIFYLFFIVLFATVFIFSNFKDTFYAFL